MQHDLLLIGKVYIEGTPALAWLLGGRLIYSEICVKPGIARGGWGEIEEREDCSRLREHPE